MKYWFKFVIGVLIGLLVGNMFIKGVNPFMFLLTLALIIIAILDSYIEGIDR